MRVKARANPLKFPLVSPRVKTAYEVFTLSLEMEKRLADVHLPFIVLHGTSDVVTDPVVSQTLYDTSKSKDKTIKLVDGVWHRMYNDDPEEVKAIMVTVVDWLDRRCVKESN
jgi:alpha-beta hydrolase superfamily lysophospholipase